MGDDTLVIAGEFPHSTHSYMSMSRTVSLSTNPSTSRDWMMKVYHLPRLAQLLHVYLEPAALVDTVGMDLS